MNDVSNSRREPAGQLDVRINSRLRARLRASDPVAAESADEERALRRIAARLSTAEPAPPARRFGYALPALALGTIVAVAWLGVRFAERPRPASSGSAEHSLASAPAHASRTAAPVAEAPASAPAGRSGGNEPGARQIQFETAGGTRVIWVLDPRFTL